MSIHIDDEFNITMTRADTFKKVLSLKKDKEVYTPDPNDRIRFAMSKGFKGDPNYELVLEKHISPNLLIWRIESEDTASLPYGKYNYDLEITYANGDVETFVDRKTITLTKEVK